MEGFYLREATEADLEGIYAVEISAFHEGLVEDRSVFLERLRVYREGFILLINAHDDEIVGYLSTERWFYKEDVKFEEFRLGHGIYEAHNIQGEELYISSTGILPEYRGNGLGKRFFQEGIHFILSREKGIKSLLLLVNHEWTIPRSIYEKAGFSEVCRFKDFFKATTGEYLGDGIVMRKNV